MQTGYCFDLAEWSVKLIEALGGAYQTHTHTRAHTHARTHTHTHAHTHTRCGAGPPNLTFAEAYDLC